MPVHPWWKLWLALAASSLVVCLVVGPLIGTAHLVVIAALGIVAPLGCALVGRAVAGGSETRAELRHGSMWSGTKEPAAQQAQAARLWRWFGPALFAVSCLKFTLVGSLSSGFTPELPDEWSYLFGGQTFALGRVTNSPPPQPEFFDAFHILCTPRWVTRYPPGHPAALALGILVGWPPAAVIGLTAGTVVWIYLLGRESGSEAAGRAAGVLALLSPGLNYLASGFLSQSTFLFASTGCYVCTVRAVRQSRVGWAAAAGVLGGWAMLTRPYSALALGAPLAAWAAWRTIREALGRPPVPRVWLHWCAALTPVLGSLGLFAIYNQATTGNPWRTAWALYNEQFEPDNSLGFAGTTSQPIPRGLSVRKAPNARSIAEAKQRFTWKEAVRRAVADPHRLAQTLFPAVAFYGSIAFVPFGWWPVRSGPVSPIRLPTLLLAGLAGHYFCYSFFYSDWGAYGIESLPFWVVLVACGVLDFWRRGRTSDRPGIALAVPIVLLTTIGLDAREVARFIGQRQMDTQHQRAFLTALKSVRDQRVIVFVQEDPRHPGQYELIHNSPDLNGPAIVVLDREDKEKLLREFPDRRQYVYDEVTGTLYER